MPSTRPHADGRNLGRIFNPSPHGTQSFIERPAGRDGLKIRPTFTAHLAGHPLSVGRSTGNCVSDAFTVPVVEV